MQMGYTRRTGYSPCPTQQYVNFLKDGIFNQVAKVLFCLLTSMFTVLEGDNQMTKCGGAEHVTELVSAGQRAEIFTTSSDEERHRWIFRERDQLRNYVLTHRLIKPGPRIKRPTRRTPRYATCSSSLALTANLDCQTQRWAMLALVQPHVIRNSKRNVLPD